MNFANDILDAIEIMVKQVVEDNATKIYTGVCKTIGTNDCVLTINGKDNTVKYYGGVPVVGTVYQVFIPFGNMSAAFIIVPGSSGGSGGDGVDSVNGKTGDVVLTASDVGALPNSGGTLIGDLTVGSASIKTNGYVVGTWLQGTATNHLTNAATKIAVQDGSGWVYHRTAEEIKSDIGLSNVDNVKQYSASNPPPYPVTSVNGKTGEVNLVASDIGAVSTNNITQTLGTSTIKVPSEKAVTDAIGAAGYGDMLKSVYDATGAIANSGGIVNYIKSSGFTFLGTDPISSTSSDTTANWQTLGTGFARYNATGKLIDQPSQYGLLISFAQSDEVFQIWRSQPSGPTYTRSGNKNGWSGSWSKIYDSSNKPTSADIGALQVNPPSIELFPVSSTSNHGGFIDFHYNRDASDYTSRIIEGASGQLQINAPSGVYVSNPPVARNAIRNIQAGTSDLIAGTSSLATGAIYLVYE